MGAQRLDARESAGGQQPSALPRVRARPGAAAGLRRRPALVLGLALAAGALAGSAGGAGPALGALAGVLSFLSGPTIGLPRWAGAAVLVAALAARPLEGPSVGAGRWREDTPGRARVEAGRGESAARLLTVAGAPRPGELVRVLGPTDSRPWPRGPVRQRGPARGDVDRFEGVAFPLPDELVRLSSAAPEVSAAGRVSAALAALRARLVDRARAREPGGLGGLLPALLLGDRSTVDPALTEHFMRTGTLHLLSLSGLHVALVAGLLLLPLTAPLARPLGPRGAALARAALVLLLVPLSGGEAPVTRAALALSLALAAPALPRGRCGERRPDSWSLWGIALALELARDPRSVRDLSLQLSYLATAGLLLGCAPLAARLARASPAAYHGPGSGWWWRVPLAHSLRSMRLALAASVAAVLATLPVAWPSFGEIAPAGVVATPLCLLPMAALLAAGWAAVLLPEALAGPALLVVELAGRALIEIVRLADALPGTPIPLPPRPAAALLVAAGAALAALRGSRGARRIAAAGFGLLLLPWAPAASGLEIVALEVGHGTAVVARGPGGACFVFDAGSKDRRGVGTLAVAPLLRAFEVTRPTVVLSHADRDHAAALPYLLSRFPPELYVGPVTAEIEAELPPRAARFDPGPGSVRLAGRGPVAARVVRGLAGPGNEGSIALVLELAGSTALLCGDAEAEGLAAVLASQSLPGPVDLLLLPHHGSETPFLGPLLARTRPAEVWVSAAREPPLARELDRRGLSWRCTARDGPLSLVIGSAR